MAAPRAARPVGLGSRARRHLFFRLTQHGSVACCGTLALGIMISLTGLRVCLGPSSSGCKPDGKAMAPLLLLPSIDLGACLANPRWSLGRDSALAQQVSTPTIGALRTSTIGGSDH
jgi:hypothetical protein